MRRVQLPSLSGTIKKNWNFYEPESNIIHNKWFREYRKRHHIIPFSCPERPPALVNLHSLLFGVPGGGEHGYFWPGYHGEPHAHHRFVSRFDQFLLCSFCGSFDLLQFTFLMTSNEDGHFLMFMFLQVGQSSVAFLLSASEMIENSTFRDVMDGSGRMDPSGLSGACAHQPRSQRHLFRPLFRHCLFGPSTSTGRCLIQEVSPEELLLLWGGEDPQEASAERLCRPTHRLIHMNRYSRIICILHTLLHTLSQFRESFCQKSARPRNGFLPGAVSLLNSSGSL